MPKYTLNYYIANGGAGEPIRLMFALAGVEFTDNLLELAGEDWAKAKHDSEFLKHFDIYVYSKRCKGAASYISLVYFFP